MKRLIIAHFRPKVGKQSKTGMHFDGLAAEHICTWLDEENEAVVVMGQWWPFVYS